MNPTHPDPQITANLLKELRDHYFIHGMKKVETWKLLARELSEAVGHEPPWGWRYIEGVYKQRKGMGPSPALAHAIAVLGAMIDGMPQVIANAEPVTVMALPGAVQPGALIQGKSIHCAYPPCPAVIVPKWGNQIYCCRECGKLHYKMKRKIRNRS